MSKTHSQTHLIERLEQLLRDTQHYAETVNRYVITSTTDLKGVITHVSQAFCRISGYDESELIGQTHALISHPQPPPQQYERMWQALKAGQNWEGELQNCNKNGNCYWVEIHIEPQFNQANELIGYMSVQQDITDRKHIEILTITDELTELYNRRHFNQVLPNEIARAKRNSQWLAFLMIDADNFKKYNDTYGHQAGDEALVAMARLMKSRFKRSGDFVFRLGGEEFAILFPLSSRSEGMQMA